MKNAAQVCDSVQLPETLMSMFDNSTQATITANFILQNTPAQTISLSLLLQQFYKTMILYSDFRSWTERSLLGVRKTTTATVAAAFLLHSWSPVWFGEDYPKSFMNAEIMFFLIIEYKMNPVSREWRCPFSESATVFESALSPPSVFLHNNNLNGFNEFVSLW